MAHIRQKTLEPYTVVIITGYENNIQNHPSIVNYPDLFEISEDDIPDNVQFLEFTM